MWFNEQRSHIKFCWEHITCSKCLSDKSKYVTGFLHILDNKEENKNFLLDAMFSNDKCLS